MANEHASLMLPNSNEANALLNLNARRRYNGQVVNGLAVNALLEKNEWEELDTTVLATANKTLNAIDDLRRLGFVKRLGGLGSLISQYQTISDMADADVDMSGVTKGQSDRVDYGLAGVPIPIIHKGFDLNIRHLLASRRMGDGLDTLQASVASRKVAEKLESMLFLGASEIVVNGQRIYGYTTHPDRNTGSASGDFGTLTNVYPTIRQMVSDARSNNYFGNYGVYVSLSQYDEMLDVHNDGSGQSALNRILTNLTGIQFVKPSQFLPDGELVLVTLSADVVDLAIAQDIVTVEWDSMGGMVEHFKVMTASAPRIKSDGSGKSGIVHYTGA